MPDLTVCKATPIIRDEPTPDAHIHITGEMPELGSSLEVWGIHYNEQAEAIELALYGSLPGGTYDRLLGHMLARKASHFCVAHGAFGGES